MSWAKNVEIVMKVREEVLKQIPTLYPEEVIAQYTLAACVMIQADELSDIVQEIRNASGND